MSRHIRKYMAFAHVALLTQAAQPGEVLLRASFLTVVIFVFLQLWMTIGRAHPAGLAGFTIPMLVWYFVYVEALVLPSSTLRQDIDDEVRSGAIAYRLVRPCAYPLQLLAEFIGGQVLRVLLTLMVGSLIALVLVGPISFSALGLASCAILTIGTLLIDGLAIIAIGLLAFWIEDTSAVHLLWRRAVMLFGGMLVPIDLLPDWLAQVCRHLPFSAMLYAPARCFAAFDPMVATSACWTLTLTLAIAITAVLVLYHAACRNLTTNGG